MHMYSNTYTVMEIRLLSEHCYFTLDLLEAQTAFWENFKPFAIPIENQLNSVGDLKYFWNRVLKTPMPLRKRRWSLKLGTFVPREIVAADEAQRKATSCRVMLQGAELSCLG